MAKVPANRPPRRPKQPGNAAVPGRAGRPAPLAKSALTEITIPSDFAHSRELQRRILDEVAANHYGDQSTFAIRISLEEALVNAIRHGNKLDPTKKVHVSYAVSPKQAEIYIEDEGTGFNRCAVPDPTCEENLEKCSGRGILLMEAYMTKVEFDHGGRRLHLIKRREDQVEDQVRESA